MKAIQYECQIEGLPGVRADAVVENAVFEVLFDLKDTRRLRAAMMDMARIASGASVKRVVLILDEPLIKESRLREEWEGAGKVIRPELFSRFSIAIRLSDGWTGIPSQPAEDECATLDEIVQHEVSRQPQRQVGGGAAYYEILRLLIHQWMLGQGPRPVNWLVETSGTSYPTVAKALDRLKPWLKRHSDRSVELSQFPRDEWARLLAVADEVRGVVLFTDHSGQPRSPESLFRRLQALHLPNVAVGGVLGTKYYYPDVDLVGFARLDLTIHVSGRKPDLEFIRRLDPALEQPRDPDEPTRLAVHLIRRKDPLFDYDKQGGILWADPVECLLDLHEARLEPQAQSFMEFFKAKGEALRG
jgi:hypothetical protein